MKTLCLTGGSREHMREKVKPIIERQKYES